MRLTTAARIPYQSYVGFGLGKRDMSDTGQPPVGGSNIVPPPIRLFEKIRNAAPIILPLTSIATLTLAGATFWILTGNSLESRLTQAINKVEVDGRDARREAELARKETEVARKETEKRLMGLIEKASDKLEGLVSTTSTGLAGLVARTSTDLQGFLTKNSADLSEARKEISSAASQLTYATVLTSNLSKDLGSHTAEINRIKQDTAQLEPMKKELTDNTSETRQIKKDTSDIQSIKTSVVAIQGQLQSIKSHEDRYVESFGVKAGSFYSGTVNGRIVAFPLAAGRTAASELRAKRFIDTGTRLEGTEIHAWVPPRRAVGNLPRVINQSILATPVTSRSPQ